MYVLYLKIEYSSNTLMVEVHCVRTSLEPCADTHMFTCDSCVLLRERSPGEFLTSRQLSACKRRRTCNARRKHAHNLRKLRKLISLDIVKEVYNCSLLVLPPRRPPLVREVKHSACGRQFIEVVFGVLIPMCEEEIFSSQSRSSII